MSAALPRGECARAVLLAVTCQCASAFPSAALGCSAGKVQTRFTQGKNVSAEAHFVPREGALEEDDGCVRGLRSSSCGCTTHPTRGGPAALLLCERCWWSLHPALRMMMKRPNWAALMPALSAPLGCSYLILCEYDTARHGTDLVILDARDIEVCCCVRLLVVAASRKTALAVKRASHHLYITPTFSTPAHFAPQAAPVCVAHLPHHVPYVFHGWWNPAGAAPFAASKGHAEGGTTHAAA